MPKKNPFKLVKQMARRKNLECLETQYQSKLRFKCAWHPDKNIVIGAKAFLDGRGCPYCAKEKGKIYRYRGGLGDFNDFLRKLLKRWVVQNIRKNEYKCEITGNSDILSLTIHHAEPFHVIRNKVLKELGLPKHKILCEYSEQELTIIAGAFIEHHKKVRGICLTRRIHKFFHKLYGNDATLKDFIEFKNRWNSGEFNKTEEICEEVEVENVELEEEQEILEI